MYLFRDCGAGKNFNEMVFVMPHLALHWFKFFNNNLAFDLLLVTAKIKMTQPKPSLTEKLKDYSHTLLTNGYW